MIQSHLLSARARLQEVTASPQLEAEILLAHVLDQPRCYLHAHSDESLPKKSADRFLKYVERRAAKEPIAYLTGQRSFWSLELQVTPNTLIPRQETECVVETVLSLFPDRQSALEIVDLGTGSGAIALALGYEYSRARVVGIDASAAALEIAKTNAKTMQSENVQFHLGDWNTSLNLPHSQQFDLIVTNPPYLTQEEWEKDAKGLHFEPAIALVGGEDGLQAIKRIITSAIPLLKFGGYLVIEHGYEQKISVSQLLQLAGFRDIFSVQDLLGYDRVTAACYDRQNVIGE